MILTWMTYAVVIGALIAVAGTGVDNVARVRKWPTRLIWAGAIAAALLWPLTSALRAFRPALPLTITPFSVTLAPMRVVAAASAAGLSAAIDRALVLGWVVLSSLLLVRLAADMIRLRGLRRGWAVHEVDGRRIRLTSDVGPAVVGVRSMEVVAPAWILSLDEPLRALVLRHEEEHRAARDPHLLIAARVATVLMPWNAAIWYAARRLRLAIELDCDARVLRAHPSPQRYGMLLLTIAQRRATLPAALAPMLSESTTQLERRILAMRPTPHRLVHLTTLGGAVVAASALVLACSVQSDAPTSSKTNTPGANASRNPERTTGYFEFKLTKQASPLPGNSVPRYPDQLRQAHVEGAVLAQFVVGSDGRPEMSTFKVLKSSDPQFTTAVKDALASMRFSPAEVDGHAVKQLITMPFRFSLHK